MEQKEVENKKIELSVALPMFRVKYIGWLALESLCRQEGVNFKWELLIAEEQKDETMGRKEIMKYKKRLKNAGCSSIRYHPLDQKISLGEKWKLLFDMSSKSSRSIVIQAADVFSYPQRLRFTWDAFQDEDLDWYKENKGIFYDISTGKIALWDTGKGDPSLSSLVAGRWFSVNRRKAVNIENKVIHKHVDRYLYDEISPKKFVVDNRGWKYGLHTHGFNNISKNRKTKIIKARGKKGLVSPCPINISETIPKDIIRMLEKSKDYLELHSI